MSTTMIDTIKGFLTEEELRMFDCGTTAPIYYTSDLYFIEGRFVRVPREARYRISACYGEYVHGRDKRSFASQMSCTTRQYLDRNNRPITWKPTISDKFWDDCKGEARLRCHAANISHKFATDKELAATVERAKAENPISRLIGILTLVLAVTVASVFAPIIYKAQCSVEQQREVEYEAEIEGIAREREVEEPVVDNTPKYPYDIVVTDVDNFDGDYDIHTIGEVDAYSAFDANKSTNIQLAAARHIVQFQTYPTKEEMRQILMEDIRTHNFYVNKYDAVYSFTEEDVNEFIEEIYYPNCGTC